VESFKSNELSPNVEGDDSNPKLLGDSFYDEGLGVSQDGKLGVSQDGKSVPPTLVKPIGKKVQRKPTPSRIDYNFFNYCSTCELKYPKLVSRCKDCNQKVRTRPWHRSKVVDRRRI
jgi:hypothetical protein